MAQRSSTARVPRISDSARDRAHLWRARVQGGTRAHGARGHSVRAGPMAVDIAKATGMESSVARRVERRSCIRRERSVHGRDPGRRPGVALRREGEGVGARARRAGNDRVARVLGAVTDSLLLIANDPQASEWIPGMRIAGDVRPGIGSLGGIHAALVHAATPVIVVAWDMPFVPEGLLAELRVRGSDARVVAPESRSRGADSSPFAHTIPMRRAADRALDQRG